MSIPAPDEISIEDPLCNSSLGSMVTLDYVTPLTGSGSTTGDRSNVSRQTAEGQGEEGSSGLAGHDAEDLNNTGVLQSVRVWTDKTDGQRRRLGGRNPTLQQNRHVILFSDGN